MKKKIDIYKVPIIDKNRNWRKVKEPLAYEWYVDEKQEAEKHPRIIDTNNGWLKEWLSGY
jgi:hypothetical protein